MDAAQIIRALGGDTAVAAECGCGTTVVRQWRRRGIASARWPALLRMARRVGASGVTLDILEAHRGPPAPRSPRGSAVAEAA